MGLKYDHRMFYESEDKADLVTIFSPLAHQRIKLHVSDFLNIACLALPQLVWTSKIDIVIVDA